MVLGHIAVSQFLYVGTAAVKFAIQFWYILSCISNNIAYAASKPIAFAAIAIAIAAIAANLHILH